MFKIKSIYTAAIVLLGANMSVAQSVVPGFLGKRLFVEGNFACLPLLVTGPTVENSGRVRFFSSENTAYPISWRTGVTLNYITGRKTSLFLGYQYFQTGMISTAFTRSIVPKVPTQISDLDRHNLFSALAVNVIEIGIESNTGSGMLAPIGAYTRWSAQYYTLTPTIVDKYTEYGSNTKGLLGNRALGLDNLSTWNVGIGLELGSRIPIAKNTLLSLGLRSNITFMSILGKQYTPPNPNYGTNITNEIVVNAAKANTTESLNQEFAIMAARTRIFTHGLIMVNVGVAYLIK